MKTTVEIPDDLYRQLKAYAALQGQTVKSLLVEALRQRLAQSSNQNTGWRSVFGQAKQTEVDAVQKELDAEFSNVDPDDWQ